MKRKKSKVNKIVLSFNWETEEEKIPAKKKLEWLRQMHEFTVKTSSKRMLVLRWKLREGR